jgi:hypothetical protein
MEESLSRRSSVWGAALVAITSGCFHAPNPETSARTPVAAGPPQHIGRFPEAEAMMPGLITAWVQTVGNPPPTALRVYVQDDDWQMERNGLGIILRRFVNVTVFYKGGETGQCWDTWGSVTQEEQHGTWGRAMLQLPRDAYHIQAVTCPSIDSLPPGVGL